MTNEYIEYIIACEEKRLESMPDPFLKNGYMGLSLFLYHLYEIQKNLKYLHKAKDILRKTCNSLKKGSKVNIWDGLCGIGTSILYLYRQHYVDGDVYAILKNLDDEIYRSVIQAIEYDSKFSLCGHEESLLDVIIYSVEKITTLSLPESELQIQHAFINTVFNTIYQNHNHSFYFEPIPYTSTYILARYIYVLNKIFQLDSFRNRAIHVWEESKRNILAQFPYLDSNKILLLFSTKELQKTICDQDLDAFVNRLEKSISFERILNKEIPSNSMSVSFGLSGILGVLTKIHSLTLNDYSIFIHKMECSSYYKMEYNELVKKKFTGLNGVLGFILTYLKTKGNE